MRYPIINTKKTGKNIYKFSQKKGITANNIQDFMNFACAQTIYRWFHGKSLPSLDNFYALSVLLGVGMETLLVSNNGVALAPGENENAALQKDRIQTYLKMLDIHLM